MPSVEFKASDYLKTTEDIAEYLNAALEDNEPRLLTLALRDVADSIGGMTRFSEKTGLNREALYRTLSEGGNPKLDTLSTILQSLGLRLAVTVEQPNQAA